MVKGQPFSVRLEEQTERLVAAEARRTRRTKSAVVEAITEETARTRRFPRIAWRGDDARRRAWVIGSGLDVWEVIHMLEDFGSAEALAAKAPLSPAQVRLAVLPRRLCRRDHRGDHRQPPSRFRHRGPVAVHPVAEA
jgi:hypothetical protein